MKINDTIYGFIIDRVRESSELGGSLVEMTHIKTGASLVWLDNKDSNKHFSIAFKTPPTDDTGVFHILEHSVLNGSKRYTVKDPFLELIKSSMNTFLNAMTSSDFTIYPVSSRNEQDFMNLIGVYLDAVFCPAIYENPNIFNQEGWHYELNNACEDLTFKGVVFNEMKGVFASPESQLRNGLYRMVFPDTCYQYEAGGMPQSIPTLTYEQFIETHTKHYHPSNSRIYLDGDVPIESVLKLIDEQYLSHHDKTEMNISIPIQKPIQNVRQTGYYQAEEGEQAYLSFGKVLCSWDDVVKRLALNILSNYLTENNNSPLKKAVLSEGLAQDVYCYIDESVQSQPVVFVAKQIDIDHEADFWQILSDVKNSILENGIDKTELNAVINQIEFSVKEISEPKALGRNMFALSTWLYGGDPMDMLDFSGLWDKLRQLAETDYFEKLLCEIPFTAEESAVYVMLPSATRDEEILAQEKETLKKAKASFSDEQICDLLKQNEKLVAWQKEDNKAEDLATLPVLPLSAVSKTPLAISTEIKNDVIFHKTADNGITHINLYFSLTGIDKKEYGAISFLTNILGELPTKSTALSQLKQKLKSTIGVIDYNVSAYAKPGENNLCHPYFVINFSFLNSKINDALSLVCEMINDTDFDSDETSILIEDIFYQSIYSVQESIISEGNRFARIKAASHVCASSYAEDMLEGYGFYKWLKRFDENFDEMYESFIAFVKKAQTTVFNSSNVTVSVASPQLNDSVYEIFNMLNKNVDVEYPDYVELELDTTVKNEAIQIPGGVSYAALADNVYNYDIAPNGKMKALAQLMSYQYLWNEIRVLGGAYGCGFMVANNGNMMFHSYRDPNPANSQKVFKKGSRFIKEYCKNDENFEKIIISAAASLEPLLDVRNEQQFADMDYFCGITYEDKCRIKKELLEMKKEDLLDFCSVLDTIAENGFVCTVAPKAHIDSLDVDKTYTL